MNGTTGAVLILALVAVAVVAWVAVEIDPARFDRFGLTAGGKTPPETSAPAGSSRDAVWQRRAEQE